MSERNEMVGRGIYSLVHNLCVVLVAVCLTDRVCKSIGDEEAKEL
jgi:hypothetical protein